MTKPITDAKLATIEDMCHHRDGWCGDLPGAHEILSLLERLRLAEAVCEAFGASGIDSYDEAHEAYCKWRAAKEGE